jgi:peptidoglycan/LPS O-acetylase OafA/YrhL
MFLGAFLRVAYECRLTVIEATVLGAILSFWLFIYPLAGAAIYGGERAPIILRMCGAYPIAVALFLTLAYVTPIAARPMVWLGKISYSLYLLHSVILYLFVRLAMLYWPKIHLGTVGWVVLLSAATIGLSASTFRYVEEPANRLGACLAKSLAMRSKPPFSPATVEATS